MSQRSPITLVSSQRRDFGAGEEESGRLSDPQASPISETRPCAEGAAGSDETPAPSRREVDMRSLLAFAIRSGASDLHLTGGQPAAIRVHGVMQRIKMGA